MDTPRLIVAFFIAVFAVVIYQSFREPYVPGRSDPAPEKACVGEPIFVDYPYDGSINEPHECRLQCQDHKVRFIYYTNKKGTQCDKLPGCNDWGEDNKVTCKPPSQSGG